MICAKNDFAILVKWPEQRFSVYETVCICARDRERCTRRLFAQEYRDRTAQEHANFVARHDIDRTETKIAFVTSE
jgi:hypothetical protein